MRQRARIPYAILAALLLTGPAWANGSSGLSIEEAVAVLEEGLQQVPREAVEVGLLPHLSQATREAMQVLAEGGEEGIAALAPALRHPYAGIRMWAARTLGDAGDPQAGPVLQAALPDPEPAVRVEVAAALGQSGDVASLPQLERALEAEQHPQVSAELRAARSLLRQFQQVQGRQTADRRLQGWLGLLRYRYAVERVVEFGPRAAPDLVGLLDSSEQAQQAGAAQALAYLGDANAIQPLLQHALSQRKSYFAQALSAYRNPAVWGALLELLASGHFSLEYWALRGIRCWQRPETQQVTLAYLERRMERNWHRKPMIGNNIPVNTLGEACNLLAEIGDQECLPILRRLILESPAGQNLVHEAALGAYSEVNARLRQQRATGAEAGEGDG